MEIQAHLMHHNPYDIVKAEEPSTPPKTKTTREFHLKRGSAFPEVRSASYVCPSTDMLFSVSNFNIQSNFCPPVNNNHDPLNNNHTKISSNGRTLAADRKRPYPCNLCTSRFGSKMELEEHQNSHTGMKPFECDVSLTSISYFGPMFRAEKNLSVFDICVDKFMNTGFGHALKFIPIIPLRIHQKSF
ncbi:unnamed protein product [Strongylus vulgaris]|uniref:C2H2-type domain-containing protein n=1 Tax=Strongylus vulgaris TaxID=40348 RepID=A0A3P7L607_STRVU|nr:unnamed protein product [Strongylus vulgaris]